MSCFIQLKSRFRIKSNAYGLRRNSDIANYADIVVVYQWIWIGDSLLLMLQFIDYA